MCRAAHLVFDREEVLAVREIHDVAKAVDIPVVANGGCQGWEDMREALRRGAVDLRELRRIVDLHAGGGRRRLAPVRLVLAERLPGYNPGANDWEKRMDRLWDDLGLPTAERQYSIVAGGVRRRVDRAIPEVRLAVEWVGHGYHGQVGRFSRDRIRISDLVQSGWDVLEVTPGWTPERLRATVLAGGSKRGAA